MSTLWSFLVGLFAGFVLCALVVLVRVQGRSMFALIALLLSAAALLITLGHLNMLGGAR